MGKLMDTEIRTEWGSHPVNTTKDDHFDGEHALAKTRFWDAPVWTNPSGRQKLPMFEILNGPGRNIIDLQQGIVNDCD